MKKILGLDLGTNSIGWALIEHDFDKKNGAILGLGSRILPMSQDILGKFDAGVSISQTAERTGFRGVRRLRERHLLRRERLHRVLNILVFLPKDYAQQIDFKKKLGKFYNETEPKLAYKINEDTVKTEFIFQNSFNEMLSDFKEHQPDVLKNGKQISYNWTIYYLRKKALTDKIEKEELAWLLLHFNQKRGYYQLRGKDEEISENKLVEFKALLVTDVIDSTEQNKKKQTLYKIVLENGWTFIKPSNQPVEWKGKIKEFIVTTETDNDGKIKKDREGKESRKFRAPNADDWTLLKKKTEFDIEKSNKTVGTYIYDTLLKSPNQKIKGKLVRTIERKFYKEELEMILRKQKEYHSELRDESLYSECLKELYGNNEAHRNSIGKKDFIHLFLNDIIFYQRPLKSKKSLISDCRYESRTYKDKDGNSKTEPIKCIAKSHPLFQEFRLWQWLKNLNIYQKEKMTDGGLQTDVNVTSDLLATVEDWTNLFDYLNDRKEIDQKQLLKYLKVKESTHRWNFVEDKTYPGNETRAQMLTRLSNLENINKSFLTKTNEEALWHILYSVADKIEIQKALNSFAQKHNLTSDFVEEFKKFPSFKNEYGSYSAKAIKKLLPLMRMGKYWIDSNIDTLTQNRINHLLSAEYDAKIQDRVREKAINLTTKESFQGLPLWLVCYVVYDRHSEDGEIMKWDSPKEIEDYLRHTFKQHSLRNPIVEQVITETLRVVADIWKQYGNSTSGFFDEIHVELGREMKNPKDQREQMTKQNTINENTNLRIKLLLAELLNDKEVLNVRPYSPSQQEILKIYEDGVLSTNEILPEDILKISKLAEPSKSELIRYKLWLEQKYRSPYTGDIIPLNKLFTSAYEIEHIIPQSRYFDNAFTNKVICESEVNKDKGDSTAYQYIKTNKGKKIELSFGKTTTIFSIEAYEDFVKVSYDKSKGKMKKLLMEDIPDSFIQRQLNDTRYISKIVKNLLSNIVRTDKDDDGTTAKNLIAGNGSITSALKQDWGLNDVWNNIVTPRFERMNELTKSTKFGEWTNKDGHKVFQTQVPLEFQKGFSKKRIDHRHHAMDALVIACASRNHINFLNNQSALGNKREEKQKSRNDLRAVLCTKKYNNEGKEHYKWVFKKPWETFTQDSREKLHTTIISFKQNVRVINKSSNFYEKWVKDEAGKLQKQKVKQVKGDNWSIRKPMHLPMPYAKKTYKFEVLKIVDNISKRELIIDKNIREQIIKISVECGNKIKGIQDHLKEKPLLNEEGKEVINTAYKISVEKFRKRQPISELSNRGQGGIKTYEDAFKFINKVCDYKLQQDLLNHLKENKNDIDIAFSPDGIDDFNNKRKVPVYNLPIAESGEKRFSLGHNIGNRHKWMEAEKGTNLFFGIYQDENKKRTYSSIPLNIVIERQKQGLVSVPEKNESGHDLLFHLSPNDMVYVPTENEIENPDSINWKALSKNQVSRIYKNVSFSGSDCFFIRNDIAASIVNKLEFSSSNKMEKTLDGITIKAICWKLELDRLGNIKRSIK